VRILKTKWFARFARKYGITDDLLYVAVDEVERGIIDADLGGGVIKKRVARPGGGKRGGYRTLLAYKEAHAAFFMYGFAKNEMNNIAAGDLATLRDAAKQYGQLGDTQITAAVVIGQLEEVKRNA